MKERDLLNHANVVHGHMYGSLGTAGPPIASIIDQHNLEHANQFPWIPPHSHEDDAVVDVV
jgi:hypothetical protein